MSELPDRNHFQQSYQGQPPWDIGRPQAVFVNVADQLTGPLLDVGCGTGEMALLFAQRGCEVTGIDFLEAPIEQARQKAASRGLNATFRVFDALQLHELDQQFQSAIDCGLFHVFSDADRQRYVAELATVLRPDGRLFLLCFSDKEPTGDGPRRVTRDEIRAAFANGWEVESIDEARFEVRPDLVDIRFSEGGPFAWFSIVRRK